MTIYEKIDYMQKCLTAAVAELDYAAGEISDRPGDEADIEEWELHWGDYPRNPNKTFVRENLRNVARMAFLAAKEW